MNNNSDNNKSDTPGAACTDERSSEDEHTNSKQNVRSFKTFGIKGANNEAPTEFEHQLQDEARAVSNARRSDVHQLASKDRFSNNDTHHSWGLNNKTPPKEVALPMRRSPPSQQIAAATNQVGASVVDGGDIGSNEQSRVPIAMPTTTTDTQNPSSNSLVNSSETIIKSGDSGVPARAVDSNPKTPSELMRDDQDDTGSPASFYTSRTTNSPDSGGHGIVVRSAPANRDVNSGIDLDNAVDSSSMTRNRVTYHSTNNITEDGNVETSPSVADEEDAGSFLGLAAARAVDVLGSMFSPNGRTAIQDDTMLSPVPFNTNTPGVVESPGSPDSEEQDIVRSSTGNEECEGGRSKAVQLPHLV